MKRNHTHSQNFIRRPQTVKTLVGHSTLSAADTVYDIGAGSGVISSVLAQKCSQVVAVEYDARLIVKLKENLSQYTNVTIVHDDALTVPLPATSSFKVFANIPFHLSSLIVRRLTEAPNPPRAINLIVQKQFANKLLIGTDSFTGLLGAFIAPWFTARIRYKLQRTDFWPHPAVDTVMIELLVRDSALLNRSELQSYQEFVEHCYARQKYFVALTTAPKDKRPSQLTAEEWIALYRSSKSA